MKSIELVSVNCCGEIGDVIVNGVEPPPGKSVFEQAEFIKQDKNLWNFFSIYIWLNTIRMIVK